MKNIKRTFGIIVLSVAIGFFMTSCELNQEYTWKFNNKSNYEVNIFDLDFDPFEFKLSAGNSRSFTNSEDSVSFMYTPADKVYVDKNATKKGGTFTFKDQ